MSDQVSGGIDPDIYVRDREEVQVLRFGGTMIQCLQVFQWILNDIKDPGPDELVDGEPPLRGVRLDAENGRMYLESAKNDVPVTLGDYIVKDSRGQFIRYSPELFESMFRIRRTSDIKKLTPVCPNCLADSRYTPLSDPEAHNGCTVCGRAYTGPSREDEFQILEKAGIVKRADDFSE